MTDPLDRANRETKKNGKRSLRPFRRFLLSAALRQREHWNSEQTIKQDDSCCRSLNSLNLPVAIWISNVFPYLTRRPQDSLTAAVPDIARARRTSANSSSFRTSLSWPSGKISKFKRPVKSLAFSPDDSTLLVARCSKKVYLYDKVMGPYIYRDGSSCPSKNNNNNNNCFAAHPGTVMALAVSPDQTILATASSNDGTIRLWELSAEETSSSQNWDGNSSGYTCLRVVQSCQNNLRYMIWSPCGNYIASWGMNGFVVVSNVHDGSHKSIRWKNKLEVSGCFKTVAFDPIAAATGQIRIAFAHDNEKVYVWQKDTGHLDLLPDSIDTNGTYDGTYITGLAYSPEIGHTGEYYLAVGCHMATIKLWRLQRHHQLYDSNGRGEVHNGGGNDEDDNNGRGLGSHDDDSNGHYYVVQSPLHLGHGWSAVTLLTFTSDGRYLACSNQGSQIRIVNVQQNSLVASLRGHTARIESLCFTSDAATLASGSCDRSVRLWDTSQYTLLQ